jgi:hypothetical protein
MEAVKEFPHRTSLSDIVKGQYTQTGTITERTCQQSYALQTLLNLLKISVKAESLYFKFLLNSLYAAHHQINFKLQTPKTSF